ncbi:hypothetical protein EVAR_84527_1 [Eumeta japonica]|uniref:Uncharacterized protein n=1 Tax=Eumeta variegata TaxID=151549 RepID=A0A4C1UHR6_EUMVA|nr:hypothetical protein EVAR_84527_1 [Eumeta japonica]
MQVKMSVPDVDITSVTSRYHSSISRRSLVAPVLDQRGRLNSKALNLSKKTVGNCVKGNIATEGFTSAFRALLKIGLLDDTEKREEDELKKIRVVRSLSFLSRSKSYDSISFTQR